MREALARGADAWCILDNTTLGAATGNALLLAELLGRGAGE
jgi:aspartate-semialdehyde dehydrogenase